MTETKQLTLEEAWAERQKLYRKANDFLVESIALHKEAFHAPSNCKVVVWYGSISSYYEAEKLRAQANEFFYQSDQVWYEVVTRLKGNIRLDWRAVGTKGYRCVLETGEVFEP